MEKTSIKKWKLPIIRWAFRQVKPLLPSLYKANYGQLEKFGIADMREDLAIYLE